MLEKLISVRNIGKIAKLTLRNGDWDGVFQRSNIIYAPNGTGKTTLSMIFQSMKGDANLIKKKITFPDMQSAEGGQLFSVRKGGKTLEYKNDAWTNYSENIEVFNVHFVEENLFTGSGQHRRNQKNFFLFIAGEEGAKRTEEIADLRKKIAEFEKEVRAVKSKARKRSIGKQEKELIIEEIRRKAEPFRSELAQKNKELGVFSQKIFDEFIARVNDNLIKFSRSLKLEKISKELNQQATFYLQFGENRVTFEERTSGHEFRYTLSEGDKSTLAIALFLAKISFATNLGQLIVIFDDPLTSLDSGRRFITIKELAKLSEKIGQLVVLTHDATFAAELERDIRVPNISLELVYKNKESWLTRRNHQDRNVTGLFRDIKTLTEFIKNGASSESERRDVLRCIRPTLEGVVRVKYFDLLGESQWLGDFIKLVRSSKDGDDLYRLKDVSIFDDLCDINDYSKGLHHSSPSERDADIDEQELLLLTEKALRLIKRI